MASLVVRAAGAAAAAARLPSLRPRRNGSGVLSGLRVGTGHYGARLALASSTESDPRMPGEDEFDHFYRVLAKKTDNLLSCYIPMPLALSEEEKAVQKEFKLIASGCIDLLVGAMRRTPAEKRRPLFLVFGELYPVFEFVRWTAEAGCAKWWMALQIIEKLEIVRKMVSSAFGGAPVDRSMVFARKVDLTGVDGEALAGHGLGSNLSVVIFVLMDSVFSNVKSDIDAMVSAASTPY
uniref:Uncharacterized protein n=1 Tax=Zea mays TaxID=4577 RepID=A0A804UD02_MAIZE